MSLVQSVTNVPVHSALSQGLVSESARRRRAKLTVRLSTFKQNGEKRKLTSQQLS
jgi:hypothetical protein